MCPKVTWHHDHDETCVRIAVDRQANTIRVSRSGAQHIGDMEKGMIRDATLRGAGVQRGLARRTR
eukprot:368612-Rhodomonas_salina.1